MKHLGLFAAGVLFGTAGLKILGSKDAKKVYAHTTAAVLRAKDCFGNGSARSRITASPKDRFRGPSELPKKLPLSRQKNAPRLRA